MHIALSDTQRDLPLSKPQIRRVVSFVLDSLDVQTDEISLHFITDKKMRQLHSDLFDDPSPTDCITCPLDPPKEPAHPHHVLGEAFICPKTALDYAKTHSIDPWEEVTRYIVHCILHLIGYEDKTVRGRSLMKRKENALLKSLVRRGHLLKKI